MIRTYEKAIEILEWCSETLAKDEDKPILSEAINFLKEQENEIELVSPTSFAQYLLNEYRPCWMHEIQQNGWAQLYFPYKEYSTEGAYREFLKTWMDT